MANMIVMVGLPLSGKSTEANKIKEYNEGTFTIVCPDDVRVAIHGSLHNPAAEPFVWATVETMVKALLIRDQSVIIDATNMTKWERSKWLNIAKDSKINPQFIHITTSEERCIQRARNCNRHDMVPVIQRMAKKFQPLEEPFDYKWPHLNE